jgi:hypothetical protein
MTIKKTVAPAHVVRAFLEDEQVWQATYYEDEEFERDGVRFTDLQGFADVDLVSVTGGDVYRRNSGQDYVGTLKEFFSQYLARSVETVVVQVDAARRDGLLALLKLHGYEFSVVEKSAAEQAG